MISFEEKSYNAHSVTYSEQDLAAELSMYRNWWDSNTTDLWRHKRMMDCLLPLLDLNKNAKWLTVGDGRMGTAAMFIERHGGNALATDIDITLLEVAKKEAMIHDFSYANAEKLPFSDSQFDYAFCKESFHHFPRPHLAWYEMLRVSSKAIVFTEPADWIPSPIPRRLLGLTKNFLRSLVGKKPPHKDEGSYEPSGNYIFSISPREFEKMALAMNLPYIAYKKIHDVFIPGVQYEQFSKNAPLYSKIKRKIRIMSILKMIGIGEFNRIQIVVFKKEPNEKMIQQYRDLKFTVVKLPLNPFME